ncbi:MAG: DUF3987 domain-containing protein, partial [Pseudomonadota bacterium]
MFVNNELYFEALLCRVAFRRRLSCKDAQIAFSSAAMRELEPRLLRLSQPARRLLVEFSDHIERAQAKGGEFETVSGYASKAQEQAARIAGILTLWEDLNAAELPAETMANAIKLAYAVSPSMWVSVSRAVSLGLGLFLLMGIQVEL